VDVLVVNVGSSTLKLSVVRGDAVIGAQLLEAPGTEVNGALAAALDRLPPADAIGRRVVHGGHRFTSAARLDASVVAALRDLISMAPLHQPKALAAVEAVGRLRPGLPAVACFDTAFHATMPDAATTYAVPLEWRKRWPIRRYGFHGLSHAYASRRTAAMTGRSLEDLRIVTCHLGAGASLAAVAGGRSVDTTMGFTPLEGVPMATRSGSVDPGALIHLLRERGVSLDDLDRALEHESGLAALGGLDDPLGFGVYTYRIAAAAAQMAAALGGIDMLAFSGGVGENRSDVREAIAARLSFLGSFETKAVPAREERAIARGVRELLAG
jgi:acetate kinase